MRRALTRVEQQLEFVAEGPRQDEVLRTWLKERGQCQRRRTEKVLGDQRRKGKGHACHTTPSQSEPETLTQLILVTVLPSQSPSSCLRQVQKQKQSLRRYQIRVCTPTRHSKVACIDLDQPEIQQTYVRSQNELQALARKIGELESEADEHTYVTCCRAYDIANLDL